MEFVAVESMTEDPPVPGYQGAESRGQKQGWSCSFEGLPLRDSLLSVYLLKWFTNPQAVPQVGDQSTQAHEPVGNIAHLNPNTAFSLSFSPPFFMFLMCFSGHGVLHFFCLWC